MYRMYFPSRVLQSQGYDVTLNLKGDDHLMWFNTDGSVKKMTGADYDVVVIQRPLHKDSLAAIVFMQAQGTAVVVEIDDDFWALDRLSPAWKEYTPANNPAINTDILRKSCELADLVTVSTPALARVVSEFNQHVTVIRNCVPAYYLNTESDLGEHGAELVGGRTIVGWSGSPVFHGTDLNACGDSIRRAVRKHDAVFSGLGDESTAILLGFDSGEALYSPWVEFRNYPRAVKSFDIGIVPLRINRFNEAKSYLKGLEYASLAVPFVASPTAEYKLAAFKGAGLLASEKHDWFKQLDRLLASSALQSELAESGAQFASESVYEKNAYRWWDGWKEAYDMRGKKNGRAR